LKQSQEDISATPFHNRTTIPNGQLPLIFILPMVKSWEFIFALRNYG